MIKPLQYQSTVAPGTVARVEPNIKWFGEFFFNFQVQQAQRLLNFMCWRVFISELWSQCCVGGIPKMEVKDPPRRRGYGHGLCMYLYFGCWLSTHSSKAWLLFSSAIFWGSAVCVCVCCSLCVLGVLGILLKFSLNGGKERDWLAYANWGLSQVKSSGFCRWYF